MYLIPITISTPTAITVPTTRIIPRILLPIPATVFDEFVLGLTVTPAILVPVASTGVHTVSNISTVISIGSIFIIFFMIVPSF